MKLRIAAVILAALMLAAIYPAWSQGFGGMGRHFGRMGVNGKTHAAATTSCASTGILNLSNVCNDIYFIGALK